MELTKEEQVMILKLLGEVWGTRPLNDAEADLYRKILEQQSHTR